MIHKRDRHGSAYKSCPKCSTTNGREHVFHRHPLEFGTTAERVTDNNPNGDQSYCIDCRLLQPNQPSRNFRLGVECSRLP
jgi:hypothetical protein